MALTLKNPHSILAALQQRPRDVVEVRMPPQGASPAWETVRQLAVVPAHLFGRFSKAADRPARAGARVAVKLWSARRRV